MQQHHLKLVPMRIYKLYRSKLKDHEGGRPVIFIKFFGQESLIWAGTTINKLFVYEKPFVKTLNDKKTYFYYHNLQKIKTSTIIGK